jgi:hypothetical protein
MDPISIIGTMTFDSNKLEAVLILLIESKGLLMENDCIVQERERERMMKANSFQKTQRLLW